VIGLECVAYILVNDHPTFGLSTILDENGLECGRYVDPFWLHLTAVHVPTHPKFKGKEEKPQKAKLTMQVCPTCPCAMNMHGMVRASGGESLLECKDFAEKTNSHKNLDR